MAPFAGPLGSEGGETVSADMETLSTPDQADSMEGWVAHRA